MITRERLLQLDFHFIEEIHEEVYIKKYARDIALYDNTTAHLVDEDRVCFWDNSGHDHARCVDMEDILCD